MSVNEREEAIMQEEKMHRSTYRVLKIFELLSATSEGMSLTGLAQRLEIPKGSLHPILKTMQAMNFIRMNDNGNYTIGQAAYFAGSSYTKNSDLLQEIDYVLKNLSSAVNQTAYFSVLSGGEVLYLLEERVPTPITIQAKRGYKYPAYATGIGKALLSGKTEKDIKTLYPEGLYKLTEYTIDDFDTLFSQMEETQKSGYSFEKEESNKDVQCIAVVMKQKNGMPLAQAAAEDIIEMIRTNHMKPGDRLENEYELAKKLNVGRSTVREAVKSLETRNILTIKRGAGTFISQNEGVAVDPLGISLMGKDEEMALELLDVRMILEPESAALAAIHADKNEIAEISRQNRKVIGMIRQGLNHHEEDARFHQLIAEATKNRIIAKLVPIIQQSVGLTVEMTSKRLTETTVSFHEQIVEAITRGDANGARSAMIAHISENRIYIIKEIERKRRFE